MNAAYNMRMSFTFGNIDASSKKQVLNLRTTENIVLLDNLDRSASYSHDIVVLTDEIYNKFQMQAIKMFLDNHGLTKVRVISALNCFITKDQIKEDQKEGLIAFYKANASEFRPHIPLNAAVITVGAALYAMTRSDHIYPADTHQRIFGVPHFWVSPDQSSSGNWVYPIESFKDIFAESFSAVVVDSYKTRLAGLQIESAKTRSVEPPKLPKLQLVDILTKEQFDEFYEANKHRKNERMVYDLETSGFNFMHDRIGCCTCSFDGVTGYYIRWEALDKRKLNSLISNNIQIGANLKFDIKFLWKHGLRAACVHDDIVVLGHVLDETRSNSLKALAYYYTPYGGYDAELDEYLQKVRPSNYLEIPEEILKRYATMDAIVTWQVFDAMLKHCKQLDAKYPNEKGFKGSHYSYYKNIRIPAVNMYAKIEYRGIYVNKAKLDANRKVVQKRIDELNIQLANMFNVPAVFDFGSPKELGKLLYEIGWEAHGQSPKKGAYATSDYYLERWAKDHPEAKVIQELRSCKVILNTFIGDLNESKGWAQYLIYHPEDNTFRMHPNFNAMGTESGRSRCSSPNMQNVPTHGHFAKEVKECLTTPDDDSYVILTVDYSALQMRLAAIDSEDPVLCSIFKSGKNADIHSATAYGVFAKGKKLSVMTVEVEHNGKSYKFLGGQIIRTKRGEIPASELLESDELII
jgi:DNA polymerase I-like protein with 3'-5' exonuclease and polymerase domains